MVFSGCDVRRCINYTFRILQMEKKLRTTNGDKYKQHETKYLFYLSTKKREIITKGITVTFGLAQKPNVSLTGNFF